MRLLLKDFIFRVTENGMKWLALYAENRTTCPNNGWIFDVACILPDEKGPFLAALWGRGQLVYAGTLPYLSRTVNTANERILFEFLSPALKCSSKRCRAQMQTPFL